MAYTRQTVVDATPDGDSVKQAVLDIDMDLTSAYEHLNALLTAIGLKIDTSQNGAANGVASLDANGKLTREQMPDSEAPVGMIVAMAYGTLDADSSFIECNGAEVLCTDYPLLFDRIGYNFGGTGLNFQLPELRGRFLRGWDHGAGIDTEADARVGGDVVGSTQPCAVQAHAHALGGAQGGGTSGVRVDPQSWNTSPAYNCYTIDHLVASTPPTDGSTVSWNRIPKGEKTYPENVAVMYCIKWR